MVIGNHRRRPAFQENALAATGAYVQVAAHHPRTDLRRHNAAPQGERAVPIKITVGVGDRVEPVPAVERDDPVILEQIDFYRILPRAADDEVRRMRRSCIRLIGSDDIVARTTKKQIVAAVGSPIRHAAVVEEVVARATIDDVKAFTPVERVISLATEQNVVSAIAIKEIRA